MQSTRTTISRAWDWEKLWEIYTASNLSIRPKTKTSKLEHYQTIIRAHDDDPERILAREAFTAPARI